ncbi:hypothetical protein BMS3Abin04_00863 [bacterium BMS3Abin04]|nr:hypothetical protein BMS3Abin04_00863 [bacterium BMS3Abin04]
MNKYLYQLDKTLKLFILTYLIVISCGVLVGLTYLSSTTNLTPTGTVTRYNGSDDSYAEDEVNIKENYPKPISEMLISTHNHIFGLSFLFFSIGLIFYFNSVVQNFWKKFFMIEPLISILVSFGSIWGMRFINNNFVYLAIISATLMYLSFFVMAGISIFELIFKKS